ncbi:HD domain-containing protein [Ornithinibacillus bavariensis]|uniref:HD domain-containing protein n=1 Tax=Ornithinibacillus bavariensis TaxID=545502 RepID=A0A919XCB9_9BACI|nr:HD domain-containing protein [Ornithinibacillus bavariensis]GIO28055.1 hypothetical protein J43TS3_26660 [Ornithinibacillus bavariensis]
MNLYEKALIIAKEAHKGQKQKDKVTDYIEHPIYVASLVKSEEEKAVALLHDVLEDTKITIQSLRESGIPEKVIAAVEVLTKRPQSRYFDYIELVKTNHLARVVKIADLKHNSDLSRITNPTEKDYERTEKYRRAMSFLKDTEHVSFHAYEGSLKKGR